MCSTKPERSRLASCPAEPPTATPPAVRWITDSKRPGCLRSKARRAADAKSWSASALASACSRSYTRSSSAAAAAASSSVLSRHTTTVASAPPVTSTDSALPPDVIAQILPVCSSNVFTHSPVRSDHSFTSPSAPADSTWVPAVAKLARNTVAVWPSKVRTQLPPSAKVHIFTVLSPDAVMTAWSTGENSTHHTPRLCPLSVVTGTRLGSRQILTVRSWLPVAMRESLGATATVLMSLSCPATAALTRREATACLPTSKACWSLALAFLERLVTSLPSRLADAAAASSKSARSHTFSSLSAPADTMNFGGEPLRPRATADTAPTWPTPTPRQRPLGTAHTRTSASLPPETTTPSWSHPLCQLLLAPPLLSLPQVAASMASTVSLWPTRLVVHDRLPISNSLMTSQLEATAMCEGVNGEAPPTSRTSVTSSMLPTNWRLNTRELLLLPAPEVLGICSQ
mmetsp:Transcript_9132/g.24602  ORF Transcript_9132/g.24602 Transcript_9132/m.24602 type:complete len:457 (+) Transcript_9132:599-1969(+)